MKHSVVLKLTLATLVLAIGAVGCGGKKTGKPVTPIPSRSVQTPAGPGPNRPIERANQGATQGGSLGADQGSQGSSRAGTTRTDLPKTESGIETSPLAMFEDHIMDTNAFQAFTVLFDFDSFTVKKSETAKVSAVGDELKAKPDNALLIDGHCDERGTEEYNRALGERRALALREYLANYGIAPERIRTRSWGEDHPVDPGHDDVAWSKNRRGEFILLLPKK